MFKKSFLVVLLMALVFNTVGLYATERSPLDSKIELNQSNVVDKITIEPKQLKHGELTKITVDFSEKSGTKLTSNSKITMDAPQDLDIFEISESEPSEIVYQGTVIGHLFTINDRKQFVVVFNEKVDQAYDHKGSFHLTAKAQYVGETPKPNETYTDNFDTTLGTDAPSEDYSISYSRTEGSSPFFYKPNGAIWTTDPNHVNWWLHINRNQDPFPSDIEITDTIKPGQVFELVDASQGVSLSNLNADYFKITIESGSETEQVSPLEFVEFGYGTFEFLSDDTFVIKILKEEMLPSNEITILYQTKITPEGKYQRYFYNDASAKYIENGQEVVKESLNKLAENISSGGIIAPELGTLRIVKLAKDGELTETLGSATFKLFQKDGSEIIVGTNNGVFETGNNGQVTTPPLTPGKYYITELSAPNFVDFDPIIKYPFEIKLNSEVGVQLVISNEVKRTSIDVEKIWNDKFETHPNVSIKLLADGIEVDQVELSDDKLTHTFTDLPQYTVSGNLINYTVEELELEGFASNITGDMETGFTVTNTVIKPEGVLEAYKLVSKPEVRQEEVFEYSIIVNNSVEGSITLNNVNVKDTLPSGISFVDSKIYVNGLLSEAIVTGNSFEVELESVSYNDNHKITFLVKADKGVSGNRINKAIVTNPEDPDNPLEPTVPVIVIPPGELAADKKVSQSVVKPEEMFIYTIEVSNVVEGSDPLLDVLVKDTLPEGIVFANDRILVNGSVASNAVISGTTFNVTVSEVEYGKPVVITFTAKAEQGAFGELINKAHVTDPNDPDNPKEPEVPVVVVPNGEIEAQKMVSKDEVKPDEVFTYTIKVSNITEGSDSIKNVEVSDVLPNGIVFHDQIIKVNGTPVSAQITEDNFKVILDELKYGEDVEISFDVKAEQGTFGELINKALIVDPEDPENPEEPEVPVDIVPDGAISAEKLVSKDEVKPEEVFTYTIKVSNTVEGSDPLNNVTVEDVLPEGLEFTDSKVYVNGVLSDATVTGQSFKLVLDTLEYGQDVEVSFDVKALEGEFGVKVNVATVTNPEDPDNPEEPEVPVVVVPDEKLHSEKLASVKEVKVNDHFKYTINVSNTVEGSKPLRNIVVKDTLPKGLEFTDSIIYVNGIAVDAEVKNNGFEIVLEEVRYGEDISITFSVHVLDDATGTIVNVATVINPENPEEPQEPEVPVTVVPDPVDPEPTPSEPKTPSTGIGSVTYYVELLLVSIISLLALLVLKRKEKQKI